MNFLPEPVKKNFIRKYVRVPLDSPPQLKIKVAETQQEIEAAYQILHDNHVSRGLSAPHSSGLRIIKYFSLPTTTTFIVLWERKIVGTMSVIADSPMGLPMDQEFDLSPLRKKNLRFGEISSLAIDRKHRNSFSLPFHLFHFYNRYVRDYMNLDGTVIAIHPKAISFYETLLNFKRLENHKVDNSKFANRSSSVGCYHIYSEADVQMRDDFRDCAPELNLYQFFKVVSN